MHGSCLEKMLLEWLKKRYDTTGYGQPSWKLLVAAVANSAGGSNPALAEKIAEKHNVQISSSKSKN